MTSLTSLFPAFRAQPLSRVLRDSRGLWTALDAFDAIGRDLSRSPLGAFIEADETDTTYVFTLVLPGFKRDDVEVQVEEGAYLTVRAAKDGAKGVWTQSNPGIVDSRNAAFRTITLPTDANGDKIEAKLEDGLLTITVAKLEAAKPRKVEVS